MSRVVVDGEAPGGCWFANKTGRYAGLSNGRGKSPSKAHRISYEHFVGQIPDGMHVCHRCDHPNCVAPHHLFVGTDADNHADMRTKRRHVDPPTMIGSHNPTSKLTEPAVLAIKEMLSMGLRQTLIANWIGVSVSCIHLISKNKKWKSV